MRLLLDTNILVPLLEGSPERIPERNAAILAGAREHLASVASLWEIAIKSRLGKLPLPIGLAAVPDVVAAAGIRMLPITAAHVIAELEVEPATKDPFDRLLLAQCQEEHIKLVTLDAKLADHPLAWRAS